VEFPLLTYGSDEFDPFFNINVADDLAVAERLLQSIEP
jgi:hypothetical protein